MVAIVSAFLALLRKVFDYFSEVFAEKVAFFPFFDQVVHCIAGFAFCVLAGKKFSVSLGAIA